MNTGIKTNHGGIYLEGFRDSGLGGLIDLSLPDAPAAAFPQLTEAEAKILLIGIVLNLQHHIGKKKEN